MESRVKYFLIAGLILVIAVVAIWNYVAMLSEPDVTSFIEQPANTAANADDHTTGTNYPGIGDTAPGTNVVRTTIGGAPSGTNMPTGGGSGASTEPYFNDDNPLVAVRDAATGRITNNPLSDSPDEHPIDVDGSFLSAENPRLNPNGIPLPASYSVQSGDNLSKISKKYYGTDKYWKKIQKANNIERPEHLYIGMKLTIPALDDAAPAAAAPAAASTLASTGTGMSGSGTYYHVVASGDSLWKIAEKYYGKGTKYKDIEAANPNIKNGRLALGQRLAIPNYSPAGAMPATTGTAMH